MLDPASAIVSVRDVRATRSEKDLCGFCLYNVHAILCRMPCSRHRGVILSIVHGADLRRDLGPSSQVPVSFKVAGLLQAATRESQGQPS